MGDSKRNISDYLGSGVFFIHKQSESEDGYNYYGYIHRSGNSYIMRENINTGEILYSDGGHRLGYWDNHASLTYTDIFSI